jgi:hypothetical protein
VVFTDSSTAETAVGMGRAVTMDAIHGLVFLLRILGSHFSGLNESQTS